MSEDLLCLFQLFVDLFDLLAVFMSRVLQLRLVILRLVLHRFLQLDDLLLSLVSQVLNGGRRVHRILQLSLKSLQFLRKMECIVE